MANSDNSGIKQSILDEISRLNNELTNFTRELTKKNIELQRANKKINELLKTDELTGIANRRFFLEYFTKMHASSSRHKLPLCLVMADIDDFKTINDHYGHQAGDQVLVAFARLLSENCREEDLAARYGGEEFIILLLHTGVEQGLKMTKRVRSAFEHLTDDEGPQKVTASFGLTALKEGDTPEKLIERTDKALYVSKETGKNKTTVLI
jgi:two-component system, cell cycle response regulator